MSKVFQIILDLYPSLRTANAQSDCLVDRQQTKTTIETPTSTYCPLPQIGCSKGCET